MGLCRRTLSILLAVCMALTLLPANAWAAGEASANTSIGGIIDTGGVTDSEAEPEESGEEPGESDYPDVPAGEDTETSDGQEAPETTGDETTPAESDGDLDAPLDVPEYIPEEDLPSEEAAMCGRDVIWSLENGTLSISGTGAMSDYSWHVSDELEEYTDAPWYSQHEEITRIVIHEGVTAIGANAFADCYNAASISIADSVASIGEGAFDGCPIMDEAAPSPVGMPVALDDTPENVRYSVLVLDISGSMGSRPMAAQKASAIKFCEALLAADGRNYLAVVTFGSSVKVVSEFSSDLNALESAINSIRTSGSTNTVGALTKAGELLASIPSTAGRSIVLCSDGMPNVGGSSTTGPFTSADSSAYYRYANAVYSKAVELMQSYDIFTLGFFHSLSGKNLEFARKFMDAIQNAGYYEVTNPDDLEFTFGDIAGDVVTPGHSGIIIVNVPKDKYMIHVVGDDGRNLSNVTVTCNGTVSQTNNYGLAEFDKSIFAGTPKITATKAGYMDWSNENSNWTLDSRGYTTIKMYPTSASKYMLSECTYSNISTMIGGTDLLTRTKTVSLGNDLAFAGDLDFGNFYLTCRAQTTDGVIEYQLWQDSTKIKTCTDGNFGQLSVDNDGFAEGGKCFVRVLTSDGQQVDTDINLQFKKAEINKSTSVSFGQNEIGFSIADNVPYLGGGTAKVALPIDLPVKVTVGMDSKIRVTFNTRTFENIQDGTEADWNGNFEKATEQFENLKKLLDKMKTVKTFGGSWKDYKSLVDQKSKFALPGVGDVSVYVAGYAEGDISNAVVSGEIYIVVEAETKTFGFNTWVWVIPVTVQVKGTAELNTGASLKYNLALAQFEELTAKFTLNIGLDAFAGVGIGKAAGIGVYGKANVALNASLGTSNGVNSVDLTGDLGIKAYLAWLEYSQSFAYNTWHLYTGNNVRSFSEGGSSGPMSAALYAADNYTAHDLSYLAEESEWMGTPMMLLDASAATQLSALLADTYRNAQPVMVSANDALYAAFLKAGADTGNIYTVVTKFDGSQWSEPVRVDNGAVMDGAPSLCAGNDGTIWLAYAQTASGTDVSKDSGDLASYAKNQSIVVGSIDPDTLAFTQTAVYAGDGYAHLQQLSLVNGVPTLAWADSTVTDANSVLWPTDARLYTAKYTGGSWGSAQLEETVNMPVLQLAAGSTGVAYVADSDGSYDTAGDRSLYCAGTLLAENVQGKVTYSALPGQAADFVWNDENCLKSASGATVAAVGITSEYAVTGSRIYYSAAGGQGAHLTAVIYDNGTWSTPVVLTGGERYLENVSVVNWQGSDYVMGMDTLASIAANDSVTDRKNLVWGQVMPTSDLRLDGVDYDADNLTAGGTVPVTLTVFNAGDHTVTNIDVTSAGLTEPRTCSIAPGKSADITVYVTCPEALTEYSFTVFESGMDDFTPEDNYASVGVGYADLAVEVAEERIGTQKSLVVYVTNNGVASADGTVTISDASGSTVRTTPITNLAAGDTLVVSCPMQQSGIYTATAALANGEEELYTYNNADTASVGDPSELIPQYTITFDAGGGSGSLAITVNEGTPCILPSCNFTPPAGQTFKAWLIGGVEYAPGREYLFTENTTVTAVWQYSWDDETYYVSVPSFVNGSVIPSARYAAYGERVILYAHPDAGYELDTITVTDIRGRNITLRGLGDDAYSFTMPSARVTVDARFKKTPVETPAAVPADDEPFTGLGTPGISGIVLNPAAMPFTDVNASHWFYNSVDYVWKHYLMSGVSDTQFAPNATTTRAMIWTILARMNNVRTDINPGSTWFERGMLWAVEQGVTDGTNPLGDITREQLATMLWRNAGRPAGLADLSQFSDSDTVSDYAVTAIRWAVANGILNGTDGRIEPKGSATRAQVAAMVARYGDKLA